MAQVEHWKFLPIAAFEHMQSANWPDATNLPSSFDICEAVNPIWDGLMIRAQSSDLSLDIGCISSVHFDIASEVGAKAPGELLDPNGWSRFCAEMGCTPEQSIQKFDVEGSAAWIVAALFWEHLPSLRLMTSWLYVSALCAQNGSGRLDLEEGSLGSLIGAMSGAGPPIYDAEDLRGNLRSYGGNPE